MAADSLAIDLTVVDPEVLRVQEVQLGILSGRLTILVEIDPGSEALSVTMSGSADGLEADLGLLREVGEMLSGFEVQNGA